MDQCRLSGPRCTEKEKARIVTQHLVHFQQPMFLGILLLKQDVFGSVRLSADQWWHKEIVQRHRPAGGVEVAVVQGQAEVVGIEIFLAKSLGITQQVVIVRRVEELVV